MHLERFNLTPAQFNAIPDAERALMVLLALGLNEVNALEKLVAMSMNFERGHVPIELAQSGQAILLVRILAGKLHEIYKLIEVFSLKKNQPKNILLPQTPQQLGRWTKSINISGRAVKSPKFATSKRFITFKSKGLRRSMSTSQKPTLLLIFIQTTPTLSTSSLNL